MKLRILIHEVVDLNALQALGQILASLYRLRNVSAVNSIIPHFDVSKVDKPRNSYRCMDEYKYMCIRKGQYMVNQVGIQIDAKKEGTPELLRYGVV